MGDTKDAEHQDKVCKHYDVGWTEIMPSSSLTTGYFHQKRGFLKRKRRASKSRWSPEDADTWRGETRLNPAGVSPRSLKAHLIDSQSAVRSCRSENYLWVLTPDLLIHSPARRCGAVEGGWRVKPDNSESSVLFCSCLEICVKGRNREWRHATRKPVQVSPTAFSIIVHFGRAA